MSRFALATNAEGKEAFLTSTQTYRDNSHQRIYTGIVIAGIVILIDTCLENDPDRFPASEGSTAAASAYRFFVSRSLPLTMRRFHNTKWCAMWKQLLRYTTRCEHVQSKASLNQAHLSASRDMDQFSLNKKVYEGKSSVVYTATDIQSETPVAIKLYKKKSLSTLNKWVMVGLCIAPRWYRYIKIMIINPWRQEISRACLPPC